MRPLRAPPLGPCSAPPLPSLPSLPLAWLAWLSCLTWLSALCGCTAVVLVDGLDGSAACDADGDCAAGAACVDGSCTAREQGDPPPIAVDVGAEGGEVLGDDGASVSVPAGALDETASLSIERLSSTTPREGVLPQSHFYRLSGNASFSTPATFFVPVDDACAGCALYVGGDGAAFAPSEAGEARPGFVSGRISASGTVVAGVAP